MSLRVHRLRGRIAAVPLALLAVALPVRAQSAAGLAASDGVFHARDAVVSPDAWPPWAGSSAGNRHVRLRSLPRNLLEDQRAFLGLPFRMRQHQWSVALPIALGTAVLIGADTAAEARVTRDAATASHFSTLSDAGVAAMVGASGGMYLWGKLAHNETARETGFLSGEAAINAFIDTELIKGIAGRKRPFTGDGRGEFFQGGSSFPSQHAAVSWAVASVIAHEYPGPLTKLLAYGLAGAVSAARVEGQKHFLGDAVLGSALGWYIGRQVYRARSRNADIDARTWGTFERYKGESKVRAAGRMGATYLPLDSWVYPVFDRLQAMGYLPEASSIFRPLTRIECARLLAQAREVAEQYGTPEENAAAAPLVAAVDRELAVEGGLLEGDGNRGIQVDSLYARFTGISRTPLRDAFHFGQTLANDYGRPYGEGGNVVAGFSQRAEAGPVALYLRAEYQYASPIPSYNSAAQQAIAAEDGLPLNSVPTFSTVSRLRPIEAYASLNLANWQINVGQQNLWWGPGRTTSLAISNNAEAMPMVRIDRVRPAMLPVLGATRTDFFLARMGGYRFLRLGPEFELTGDAGHTIDPQPYLWGLRVAFKPTINFEFGVGIDSIIGGLGRPLNLKTFLHSLSSEGNAQAVEPGDRKTVFNFAYRLPKLRNWLTLYADGIAEDESLPLLFPRRSAMHPGVYLARVPGLPKLDLRVEGVYTNLPGLHIQGYFYFNSHYAEGYRNYGQLIGSWVGRQGTGVAANSNYWFSARNRISVAYRRMWADSSFLQGGQIDDCSTSVRWMLRPSVELSVAGQYERWRFPLLNSAARSNFATSIQLRFFPRLRFAMPHKRASGALRWPSRLHSSLWPRTALGTHATAGAGKPTEVPA